MGQQQLILLVLGIVVVGLAVVVGINAFTEKSIEADFDAIAAESMRVAGNALTWKAMPRSLGGGKESEFLTGLTFDAMGYESGESNSQRSYTSRFARSLGATDSSRPYVLIRSQSNRDIRVQLFMFGQDEDCLIMRRAIRVEGEWQEDGPDASESPSGCSGW